ncbi:MAG: BlaI/MecI/CopY family transcriptional regulator [Oscillospiraceae bacterium]|jgi:BlaI family penicillinase repressor|nr:BlaI/MecI/CopY family transcriptional regulator [Oscillospiraceae bacterium]
MKKKISITDSELEIMKVLWELEEATSSEIFEALDKNRSTLKTLLLRLVQKGMVGYEEITSRIYRYIPLVSRNDYISYSRKSLIEKAFDGSAQKMLLNFVKEEKITKEELENLIKNL